MSGFRLATLERLREQNVTVAARALHEAAQQLADAERHRQDLADRLQNAAPVLTASSDQMVQAAAYRDVLREQITAAGVEIARLEGALVQARAAWVQANARLRAVLALHERYRLARRQQVAKREQQETDELAGNQAARRGESDLAGALLDQTGVAE